LVLYIAAGVVVAGGFFLHWMVLPNAPELAYLTSLLSGVIATAVMSMLGREPF